MRKSVLVAALIAAVLVLAPVAHAQLDKQVAALCVEKLGKDAESIRVAVVGDKAVLTGQVAEKSTAELAEEVALSVPGIAKVDNQLEAKTAAGLFKGKAKKEAADSKLESAVNKRIKEQVGAAFEKALKVEATDGVVSIRGKVPDQTRKDQALQVAKETGGVKKVIDLIAVGK